ncbi:MAG: hypothetical protein ACRD9L_18020, partial [Bryobacteraceae bacterium]
MLNSSVDTAHNAAGRDYFLPPASAPRAVRSFAWRGLLLVSLFSAASAWAQMITGSVTGTVRDSSGAVVT